MKKGVCQIVTSACKRLHVLVMSVFDLSSVRMDTIKPISRGMQEGTGKGEPPLSQTVTSSHKTLHADTIKHR